MQTGVVLVGSRTGFLLRKTGKDQITLTHILDVGFFFGFESVYYLSFCGTINYVQRRSETFF